MAQLVLTAAQQAIINSLETPMENAFGDGVAAPVLAPYEKYKEQSGETRALVKDSFKSMLAAYVSVLPSTAPTPDANISVFSNGYSLWADANYNNGVVRYWKDFLGEVHLQGLVKVPPSGGVIFQAMFTMPVGFRPAPGDAHICPAVHNDAPFAIQIDSAGVVTTRMAPIANGWIAIHIHFRQGG